MGLGFLNPTSQLRQANVIILIRRSVYMSVLLCIRQKNDIFSLSLPSPLYQGNTLLLTNVFTYPHCFLTTYKARCQIQKTRPILMPLSQEAAMNHCKSNYIDYIHRGKLVKKLSITFKNYYRTILSRRLPLIQKILFITFDFILG